jgi:hypothetical protein
MSAPGHPRRLSSMSAVTVSIGVERTCHGHREAFMSSRAEESHLRALPEPCMNLSIHTAPDVRPLP